MTNAEYFEKNKISFSHSMKLFNKSKIKSFDEFLKCEHIDHKFKCGDIVVLQLNVYIRSCGWDKNVVFRITGCSGGYYSVKYLTPINSHDIGYCRDLPVKFIDENCILY